MEEFEGLYGLRVYKPFELSYEENEMELFASMKDRHLNSCESLIQANIRKETENIFNSRPTKK